MGVREGRSSTVRGLGSGDALLLLNWCVDKIKRRPTRYMQLSGVLRFVVKYHAGVMGGGREGRRGLEEVEKLGGERAERLRDLVVLEGRLNGLLE